MSPKGMATPYFMLVQMNNAALLEAYATLGIAPRPAEIEETRFPAGFSAIKALSPIPFGAEDVAEHPGEIHGSAFDPISEAEQITTGKAADALSLGQKVAARFGSNVGDGGDFKDLLDKAMAAASLPEIDFDPDIFATGAAILEASGKDGSVSADFAGSAPFTGFRADYRPETAPASVRHTGAQVHSVDSTHHMIADPKTAHAISDLAIIATRRHHLKGFGG